MAKVLALTTDGRITYCTAPEDQRGKGRCNHVSHQEKGQSAKDFIREIKDSTLQKDLEAVKQNGRALEFVKNQTPEIIAAAIEQDPDAIVFAKI